MASKLWHALVRPLTAPTVSGAIGTTGELASFLVELRVAPEIAFGTWLRFKAESGAIARANPKIPRRVRTCSTALQTVTLDFGRTGLTALSAAEQVFRTEPDRCRTRSTGEDPAAKPLQTVAGA